MTQTIKHLVRLDLIALNSKQKRLIPVMLILLAVGAVGAVFVEPALMLICMLIVSGMLPGMLFRTEESSHSAKVFSVLPVERKDVVSARFLLLTASLLCISLLSGIMMQISYHIHIFVMKDFYDDIFSILMPDITDALKLNGFYKALFALVFMFCMGHQAKGLRKYFREGDTAAAESSLRRIGKKVLLPVIIILLFELVVVLIGMPAFKVFMSVLSGLCGMITTMLKLRNGLVMLLIFIAAGFGFAAYHYTAATLEYDDKEL
ncbi:MAG: ABC-2 transporter permease [Oscillospiraceae bacterium]|nr:ABC-2 transporter permease [Oscillospiraceae bacterium]